VFKCPSFQVLAVVSHKIYKRHWMKKHPEEAAQLEAAHEAEKAAEDPIEEAEHMANRIRFGLQQSMLDTTRAETLGHSRGDD